MTAPHPQAGLPTEALHRRAKAGFTLIEALVAIAIFATFTSLMITAYPLSIKIVTGGNRETVATNLTQAKIESIHGIAYENLPAGVYENDVHADANPASPFYGYRHTVTITYVDDLGDAAASDTGLKRVAVATTWQDPLRGSRTVAVATYLTRY